MDEKPVVPQLPPEPEFTLQEVEMQRVFITFSNGRKGVFSGPMVFSSAELKLTQVQVVDLAFTEPFKTLIKVPKVLEAPSATDESKK